MLLQHPDVRLVTLTGTGGVGKTRLALRVAEQWASAFTDGLAFISLAEISDPNRIASVVAEKLGVFDRAARDPIRAVQDYLADRAFLLVLDNFEHLLGAGPLLTEWLTQCRWLTILVTSRFRMNVSGEYEVVVHPLPVPERAQSSTLERMESIPSVKLFVARARAASAAFRLSPENAGAIEQLCAHLEGLPLAIELAAARMSHLSPADLLDRLQSGTQVLDDGPRDQPDRLRSLERAIAWSFDLLSDSERVLIQRLSVFSGGFDVEAAEAVVPVGSGTLDGIGSLVNKSFLVAQRNAECSRYGMLESIREFSAARLDVAGETELMRQRHADYFVYLAEREDAGIWGGPLHRSSLDRLEADLLNCRSALTWLEQTGDGVSLLRLAAALGGIWHYRSHWFEGRTWLAKGLLLGGDSVPAARGTALVKRTILTSDLGESPDPAWVAEAVQIRRALKDDRALARALLLSSVLVSPDDLERKRAFLAESEYFNLRSGNETGMAWIHFQRSRIQRRAGDLEGAHALMVESISCFRKDQFFFGLSGALIELADLEIERGNDRNAAAYFREMLELWDETRSKELLVNAISRIAEFLIDLGNPEEAVSLIAMVNAIGPTARLAATPRDLVRATKALERATAQLSEEQVATASARGRHASIDRLIEYALALLATVGDVVPFPQFSESSGLTVREIEVIRLIADGKSNREIAASLSIGESTAISHVRNIFSKLGLTSRTAAATWAIRQGLDRPA